MKDWQIRCIIAVIAPVGLVLSALEGAYSEVKIFFAELSYCWTNPQDTRWGRDR